MKENGWRTAARYGLPFGVGLALLGCGVQVLRAVDPLPQLRILTWLWLIVGALCAFLVGMFAARASGSLSAGVRAGAIACALAATIVFFIFVLGPAYQRQQADPNNGDLQPIAGALLLVVILLVFSVGGGGLFGALTSLPGALLGRSQARRELAGMPSLPEHLLVHHELPGAPDDASLPSDASSRDIVIDASWTKGMLFFALALAFVLIGYFMTRDEQNAVIGWITVAFFGLAVPLAPLQLLMNRPLLRFTEEGIAYKGAYLWRHGFVPWNEVAAIVLNTAPNKMLG